MMKEKTKKVGTLATLALGVSMMMPIVAQQAEAQTVRPPQLTPLVVDPINTVKPPVRVSLEGVRGDMIDLLNKDRSRVDSVRFEFSRREGSIDIYTIHFLHQVIGQAIVSPSGTLMNVDLIKEFNRQLQFLLDSVANKGPETLVEKKAVVRPEKELTVAEQVSAALDGNRPNTNPGTPDIAAAIANATKKDPSAKAAEGMKAYQELVSWFNDLRANAEANAVIAAEPTPKRVTGSDVSSVPRVTRIPSLNSAVVKPVKTVVSDVHQPKLSQPITKQSQFKSVGDPGGRPIPPQQKFPQNQSFLHK